MKVKSIEIKNFRSIRECEIDFDDFNTIVGQNNHGKTNLFDAINWFFNGFARNETVDDIRFRPSNGDEPVTIEIVFLALKNAVASMTNPRKKTAMEELFGDRDEIRIRRTSSIDEGKKRQLLRPDDGEWSNIMGADSTWNDLLPTLEYVNTKVRLSDVSGYKKATPIGDMLSDVLSTIIETNAQYADFRRQFTELFDSESSEIRNKLDEMSERVQSYLQKQFPDGTRVKFDVQNPIFDDLLKNFDTEVDDGVPTAAEEKGDGMQRAIMLAIIQVYADYRRDNHSGKKFIFLIDEAELHLHPSAQRALKRALVDISDRGEQVFVNTHSSVLVTDFAPGQLIAKAEKVGGETQLSIVNDDDKPSVIFELLGGSPSDLLLPKNFMIVEGRSDFKFVQNIFKRFYPEQYKGVQIIFAAGDISEQEGSYHGILKMFNPIATAPNPLYKEKAVILCDKPNKHQRKRFERFKQKYPYLREDNQIFILPECSIEECYPDSWRKAPQEVAQMSGEEKTCLAEIVSNAICQTDFETSMPKVQEAIEKTIELGFP